MLIKATLVGVFAASTPLYFMATQNPSDQDPVRDAEPAAAAALPAEEIQALQQRHAAEVRRLEDELRGELDRLRDERAAALERAASAEASAADLAAQLDECMGFLLAPRERGSSCKPSRRMMSHYQWMKQHGHDARAQQALDAVVEEFGNDNSRLNSVAWHLMTDDESAGQYDDLALALTERMLKQGHCDHRMMDTAALAKFLAGDVDGAIALQKQAIEHGGNSDDYRRRLRTYEAAKKAASAGAEKAAADGEKSPQGEPSATKKRRISDD